MEYVLSPNLTEPGVLYFLKESLKKCNEKKAIFYNTLLTSNSQYGSIPPSLKNDSFDCNIPLLSIYF